VSDDRDHFTRLLRALETQAMRGVTVDELVEILREFDENSTPEEVQAVRDRFIAMYPEIQLFLSGEEEEESDEVLPEEESFYRDVDKQRICSMCGGAVWQTPSGYTCDMGHGGADVSKAQYLGKT
jgi:hypothetical protein